MKDLEKHIRNFLAERKWNHLRPGDLAKSVAIEAGELLELFQWDNPSLAEVKNDPEKLAQIKKELADVLIYCLDMASVLEFDTERIIMDKLDYAKKKYPVELFKDRPEGTDAGTEAAYWKVKKEHRQKS